MPYIFSVCGKQIYQEYVKQLKTDDYKQLVVHKFLCLLPAVYHKRGNHTVTLYEKRVKIRYHLRGSPLG